MGAPTTDAGTVLDHPPRRRRGRDPVLAHLPARARRLPGRPGARRRRGAAPLRGGERRPRRARHHAAKSRRPRGLPPAPRRRARCRSSCSRPATTSSTRCSGLELGADDYITKPFSIREFRSRVRALLRRAATPHHASRRDEVIDRGDVVIDLPAPDGRGARRAGAADVRRVRAARAARLRARASCSAAASCSSGSAAAPTTASRGRSTCTCAICARRSSATPREPELILTVRGAGYRFRDT